MTADRPLTRRAIALPAAVVLTVVATLTFTPAVAVAVADTAHDLANQLTSTKAGGRVTTYSYDEAGRLIGILGPQETLTNSYDAVGRLSSTKTTAPGGDQGSQFAGHAITTDRRYDGDGALVELTEQRGSISRTQSFTWDMQASGLPQVLTSTGSGGNADFVYGHAREFLVQNGRSETFALNALGSSVRTLGTQGFVEANDYDAFGVPGGGALDLPATGAIARFGYRGELNVDDTIHLRARDYDPGTGRFSTKDPLLGIPGTPALPTPTRIPTTIR